MRRVAGHNRFAEGCGRLCPAVRRSWQEATTKQIGGLNTPMFAVLLWLVLTTAGCQAHAVWWIVARPG